MIDAIQFLDDNEESLEDVIIWASYWWNQGVHIQLQAHTAGKKGPDWHWVTLAGQVEGEETLPEEELTRLNDRDWLIVDEFNKFHILSERDFTKRYYRRPL